MTAVLSHHVCGGPLWQPSKHRQELQEGGSSWREQGQEASPVWGEGGRPARAGIL